jgi:Cysteine rich repeat
MVLSHLRLAADTNTFQDTLGRRRKRNQQMLRSSAPFIVIVLMSLSSAALAQEGGGHHGACRADAQKLCAGVEHGGGRILDCLAGQKDKLSDDCRKMVEARGR